ncbi:MAG: hypothetical protein RMJ48_01640 [Roseiflexaceae bacterium]|nr:hypothetical protein [Roseiflexaceae bacterium]
MQRRQYCIRLAESLAVCDRHQPGTGRSVSARAARRAWRMQRAVQAVTVTGGRRSGDGVHQAAELAGHDRHQPGTGRSVSARAARRAWRVRRAVQAHQRGCWRR